MKELIIEILSEKIDKDLVKDLVNSYVSVKDSYIKGDVEGSLSKSGKFVENIFRVLKFIKSKKILKEIKQHDFIDISDELLKADGSSTYQNLGVNTLMIVSQLILRAEAVDQDMALYQYINHLYNTKFKENVHLAQIPTAIYNMINGGKHGTKNLDFQEFHVVTSTSTKFSKSLEFAVATYNGLKNLFYERNADVSVSEEGGFTPNLFTNTEAFEIIKEVLLSKKVKLGVDVFTGLDCAPSYYFKDNKFENPFALRIFWVVHHENLYERLAERLAQQRRLAQGANKSVT